MNASSLTDASHGVIMHRSALAGSALAYTASLCSQEYGAFGREAGVSSISQHIFLRGPGSYASNYAEVQRFFQGYWCPRESRLLRLVLQDRPPTGDSTTRGEDF